jgi:hypothetical protein
MALPVGWGKRGKAAEAGVARAAKTAARRERFTVEVRIVGGRTV